MCAVSKGRFYHLINDIRYASLGAILFLLGYSTPQHHKNKQINKKMSNIKIFISSCIQIVARMVILCMENFRYFLKYPCLFSWLYEFLEADKSHQHIAYCCCSSHSSLKQNIPI